jgi:long-chain acyl-CoA synthetase
VRTVADVEAELAGPGGLFEIGEEEVLGERMQVFANRARSLREFVANSVGFGDREYVVFPSTRLTFAEHARVVASVAAALRDGYGVGPGDRVAIWAANCPEWVVTFWATVSLGAIAVGLNGWWAGDELRYGLTDCEPKLLLGDEKRLARLGPETGVGGVPVVSIEDGFGALWHHDLDASLPDTPIAEDDAAVILYTSGTTGRPKGAVNSHRNVAATVGLQFFHGLRLMMLAPPPPADAPPPLPPTQLVTSPLFHVSGLHAGAVAYLAGGVRSVWTTGRFDPVTVMQTIEKERVTGWSAMPTNAWRVASHPDAGRYDLSSVKTVGGGGAPFSPELRRRIKQAFPGVGASMGMGYGLTESSALVSIVHGQEWEDHPDSVGRPLPTLQVEIRDPDGGQRLPAGTDGEIHVRGPVVMLGYWRRPEETAATILPGRWLRTGDVGRLDEEGYLYLATRRRDLILRGAENVYPAEIEQRLEEHPLVGEAAVVGVPHEELGQEVKAVVVPAEGARPTPEELAAWVGEALAYFKVPAHWELRTEPLPRNAAGKVMKHVLTGEADNPFVEE